MKPYRISAVLLLFILILGAARTALKPIPLHTNEGPGHANLRQAIPQAVSFREIPGFPVYAGLNLNQEIIGYAFSSRDIISGIDGYGGPIHLLISITPDGNLQNIIIEEHQETPGFMDRIETMLAQCAGHNIQTPLIIGQNINGITGATVTSQAITATINAAAQNVSEALDLQSPLAAPSQKNPAPPLLIVLGIFLFVLSGWSCLKRSAPLRWTALGAGFLILGLAAKNMLSTSHIAAMPLWEIPAWSTDPLTIILILGAVLSCLWIGRIYCAGVCPFGFVEEALYAINTTLFRRGMSPHPAADYVCRWIKYILLITLLFLCLTYEQPGIGAVEPYITLFTFRQGFWAWALLAVSVAGSFFFMRFWCRYLCPFGAFLAMIAQFRAPQRKGRGHICADRAECFYCDRCACPGGSQAAPRQTLFFIILISASVITLALSVQDTLRGPAPPGARPSQKTLAAPADPEYSDNRIIKKQLQDAGIIPHPAKYWRVIHDE